MKIPKIFENFVRSFVLFDRSVPSSHRVRRRKQKRWGGLPPFPRFPLGGLRPSTPLGTFGGSAPNPKKFWPNAPIFFCTRFSDPALHGSLQVVVFTAISKTFLFKMHRISAKILATARRILAPISARISATTRRRKFLAIGASSCFAEPRRDARCGAARRSEKIEILIKKYLISPLHVCLMKCDLHVRPMSDSL